MDKDAQQNSGEWREEAALLLSSQLMLEYNAFYFYSACTAHFDDPSVCLQGLASFFKKSLLEENEHAQKIIRFMNMRQLKISFRAMEAPDIKKYGTASNVLKASKEFEESVLDNIETIYSIASKIGDAAITQFLDEFVAEQVKSISELNDMWVNCIRCGDDGMGLFVFDQSLLQKH